MNWEDERYVRVYTRDTAAWIRLGWEAQGLLMQLIRKADRAGVLDLADPAADMALMLRMPEDVVTRALAALLKDGCVQEIEAGLLIVNFVAAQESRQSDAARQRESREKRRLAAMLPEDCHDLSQPVTEGHQRSRLVTPAVPSRAVPAVPEKLAGTSGAPPAGESVGVKSDTGKKPRPPTNPRLALVKAMLERVFEELRAAKYLHLGAKDTEAIKRILSVGDDPEIERRWRFGLNSQGFERCESIAELGSKWNRYATGPPGAKPRTPSPQLPDTVAGAFWGRTLNLLRGQGKDYAVEWLERMKPTGALNGELHLEAPDKYFVTWVEAHYQELLAGALAELELRPVIHIVQEKSMEQTA